MLKNNALIESLDHYLTSSGFVLTFDQCYHLKGVKYDLEKDIEESGPTRIDNKADYPSVDENFIGLMLMLCHRHSEALTVLSHQSSFIIS